MRMIQRKMKTLKTDELKEKISQLEEKKQQYEQIQEPDEGYRPKGGFSCGSR